MTIICMDGIYAFSGSTASEAYSAYITSGEDHSNLPPDKLKWFTSTEMKLELSLVPSKPPASPTTAKPAAEPGTEKEE